MTSFFHFGPEEGEMSGWPELDLQNFRELRLDLFQKVLHFIRIMDQGVNQSREQVLHMLTQCQSVVVVDHLH
jgi:hypothetical protein